MNSNKRWFGLALSILLLGLNFVALNYLVGGWSTARIDLTEEGIYSITPATKRILGSMEENLTLYGFFSKRTHPKLAPLVPEIVDLLDEYAAVSGGKVRVEIFDPGEDEEAEELAADRFGVQSAPFQLASKYETGIVNAYFSIVVQYGDQYERYGFGDLIAVDATPDGDFEVKLRNLEYDLTRAIKKVVYGFRSANELFERIETPVRLKAYITEARLPEMFADVPESLRAAAAELSSAGGDAFIFEEFDPDTDPAAEQTLRSLGLPPLSMDLFSEQSFYLYAILENDGRLEQIVLTDQNVTQATLREAVEASLRRSTPGFLQTVGVVVPTPPQLPPQLQMQMPQAPPEFEELKRYLAEEFEVRVVSLTEEVPNDVDTLVVVKPKILSNVEVFNLDQYVMRGGRTVLCVGNYESSLGSGGLRLQEVESGLEDWLEHHGIQIAETLVLDDRNQALPIPEIRNTALGQIRSWKLAPYPYLVQVREDGFVDRDITSTLDSVGIYWGSPVNVTPGKDSNLTVEPILQSSEKSWTDPNVELASIVQYSVPTEGLGPSTLAVALSGNFESYFANRDSAAEAAEEEDSLGLNSTDPTEGKLVLKRSPETRMVVVGNGEFVNDFVARSIGQTDGGFFLENLRFMQNVIDWLSLDNDLATIRSRGLVSRRLDRIDDRKQLLIEMMNYTLPLALLLGVGVFLQRRRRARQQAASAQGGAR